MLNIERQPVMMTMQQKLDSGQKVPVTATMLDEATSAVKDVGIHHKLKELLAQGIVEEKPGNFPDGMRYYYKNRPVKVHSGYFGPSNWKLGEQDKMEFVEPHDVVVDKKTKQILCMAKCEMHSSMRIKTMQKNQVDEGAEMDLAETDPSEPSASDVE
jgi:hypothetical protein